MSDRDDDISVEDVIDFIGAVVIAVTLVVGIFIGGGLGGSAGLGL